MNLIEIDLVGIIILFLLLWGLSGIMCWIIGTITLSFRIVWNAYLGKDYYDASIAWKEFNDFFYPED